MERSWKFETAVAFLTNWSGHDTDYAGVSDVYYEAEEFVLDQQPASPEQASALINVIIDNVSTGLRSDGREIQALRAVSAWIVNAQLSELSANP